MPTDAENVQYLYLILTHGGTPSIDWDAVGAALNLKKGAVTKRWSRLKVSMEKGETPTASTYPFLWLCVKHSNREKVPNWNEIAALCGTTPCAASKRYSRMKHAFESGASGPNNTGTSSPVKNTPTKPSSRKPKPVNAANDDEDNELRMPPKRKRSTPKKKGGDADLNLNSTDPADEDAEEEGVSPSKKSKVKTPPKRASNEKVKVKKEMDLPTPTTEATTIIKAEEGVYDDDEEAESFFDAKEHASGDLFEAKDGNVDRVADWLNRQT